MGNHENRSNNPFQNGVTFGFEVGRAVRAAFQRGSTKIGIVSTLRHLAAQVEDGLIDAESSSNAQVRGTTEQFDMREVAQAAVDLIGNCKPDPDFHDTWIIPPEKVNALKTALKISET